MIRFRRFIYVLLLVFLVALISREFFYTGTVVPPQQLNATPIIDMHIHIAGLGYGSDSFISDDFVAKQVAHYPSLYFGASINPYRPDALDRLEQAKQQGAVLIKWIPNIQHIDPADKKLIPFYQKLKELNLPLLSHAGQERSFGSAIDEYGDPQRLRLPLSLGVTVIAGHIATTGKTDQQSNYQRILELFDEYPNLYSDISSLTQINKLGYLNTALIENRLKNQLIYGSDFPLVNMVLVSPYYFPLNLTLKQMWQLSKINNPLDRDIALKQALGMPADIFARSGELLSIGN